MRYSSVNEEAPEMAIELQTKLQPGERAVSN
jgi:hypothetical protein